VSADKRREGFGGSHFFLFFCLLLFFFFFFSFFFVFFFFFFFFFLDKSVDGRERFIFYPIPVPPLFPLTLNLSPYKENAKDKPSL